MAGGWFHPFGNQLPRAAAAINDGVACAQQPIQPPSPRQSQPRTLPHWRAQPKGPAECPKLIVDNLGFLEGPTTSIFITPTIPKIISSHGRTSVTKATTHPSSSSLCFW
jgi:hypothetical protein